MIDILKNHAGWLYMQVTLAFVLLSVAVVFFITARIGPVMQPEVFGAAVYEIPAEVWAFSIALGAVLQLWGLTSHRWLLSIIGDMVQIQIFGSFVYMALTAAVGDMVVLFAFGFIAMQLLFLAVDVLKANRFRRSM